MKSYFSYSLFLFFLFTAAGSSNYANPNLLSIDIDLFPAHFSKSHGVPSMRISLLVQKSNAFRLDPNLPLLACGLLKDLFPETDLANCLSLETDSSSSASSSLFTNKRLHLGKGALIDPRSILRNGDIIDGSLRNSNQINQHLNEIRKLMIWYLTRLMKRKGLVELLETLAVKI